jgi:hypothetical protein
MAYLVPLPSPFFGIEMVSPEADFLNIPTQFQPLFSLHNLPPNFTPGICGSMQIEIPLAIRQVLCLFGRQGRAPINRTHDRVCLDGKLRLGIGPFRR